MLDLEDKVLLIFLLMKAQCIFSFLGIANGRDVVVVVIILQTISPRFT